MWSYLKNVPGTTGHSTNISEQNVTEILIEWEAEPQSFGLSFTKKHNYFDLPTPYPEVKQVKKDIKKCWGYTFQFCAQAEHSFTPRYGV